MLHFFFLLSFVLFMVVLEHVLIEIPVVWHRVVGLRSLCTALFLLILGSRGVSGHTEFLPEQVVHRIKLRSLCEIFEPAIFLEITEFNICLHLGHLANQTSHPLHFQPRARHSAR